MRDAVNLAEELVKTAYAFQAVPPGKRRQLMEAGIATALRLRAELQISSNVVPIAPRYMSKMPELAAEAGQKDAVEIIIAAGMMLLAAEIERLCKLG